MSTYRNNIKYRTPYNLKIKTLNGAKAWDGWKWSQPSQDRDNLMLHANFQILIDFVDKEKPSKFTDWGKDEKVWKKITRLYKWWKEERPMRVGPWDILKDKYGLNYFECSQSERLVAMRDQMALKDHWDKEDNKFLIDLMKIRLHLWT